MPARCAHCPAAAGLGCPAITRPHPRYCELVAPDHPEHAGYRAIVARMASGEPDPEPAPEPPLPSPLAMARNLAGAVAAHVGSGLAHADPATVAARLATCHACPSYRPSDGRCAECGCGMEVKAEWLTSACPLGKWPEPEHCRGCPDADP